MKIALIGYGKMGKTIERIALQRGHEIIIVIDKDNIEDLHSDKFKQADVAIEFTQPVTAFANICSSLKAGVPVVCGTTGWLDRLDEAKHICTENHSGLFYASNYSLGVNIFFHLNKVLARVMQQFDNYDISMEEVHHVHKLDAPSGTALSLANDIIDLVDRKKDWSLTALSPQTITIEAKRIDEVPGTHTVRYESEVDSIEISHLAKNRDGFALGAVVAAEFMIGKKGFYTMDDMLQL